MGLNSGNDELAEKVIKTIAATQRIPEESISIGSTFEELKIDSLDGINIVFALENQFGIDIPDESVHSLRNVRETVEGIRTLLNQKDQTHSPAGPP